MGDSSEWKLPIHQSHFGTDLKASVKQCHKVQNCAGSTHGWAADPALDINDEQTKKISKNMDWVCLAGMKKG